MKALKRLLALSLIVCSIQLSAADPGVSDNTITLGMSSPFSGPNSAYGLEMRQTIEAYFDQINKAGGINGRKLELVASDDGYESLRTTRLLRFQPDDRVDEQDFRTIQSTASWHYFGRWHAARTDLRKP
jgi:hypothetical protein